MKKIILAACVLYLVTACNKSETQYTDQNNKRESVNNPQSDTINTLEQRSDTLQDHDRLKDVHTDNE